MHYYYDSTSNDAALLLSEKLKYIIKTSKDSRQETIILCVGSDRSTGDSLGPIVGTSLKNICSVTSMSMATLRILSMPPICQNILNASTRHSSTLILLRLMHH